MPGVDTATSFGKFFASLSPTKSDALNTQMVIEQNEEESPAYPIASSHRSNRLATFYKPVLSKEKLEPMESPSRSSQKIFPPVQRMTVKKRLTKVHNRLQK